MLDSVFDVILTHARKRDEASDHNPDLSHAALYRSAPVHTRVW